MRLDVKVLLILIIGLMQTTVHMPAYSNTVTIPGSKPHPSLPIRNQDIPTTVPLAHTPQKLLEMKNTSISEQMKKEIKGDELSQKMSYLYLQIWRRIQLKDIRVPESYLFRYDQQLVKQLALMDQKDLKPGFDALEKVWIEERDYLDELDEIFKKIEVYKTAMGRLWDNLAKVKTFYTGWSEAVRQHRNGQNTDKNKSLPE